jgi:hypothetical protein
MQYPLDDNANGNFTNSADNVQHQIGSDWATGKTCQIRAAIQLDVSDGSPANSIT